MGVSLEIMVAKVGRMNQTDSTLIQMRWLIAILAALIVVGVAVGIALTVTLLKPSYVLSGVTVCVLVEGVTVFSCKTGSSEGTATVTLALLVTS